MQLLGLLEQTLPGPMGPGALVEGSLHPAPASLCPGVLSDCYPAFSQLPVGVGRVGVVNALLGRLSTSEGQKLVMNTQLAPPLGEGTLESAWSLKSIHSKKSRPQWSVSP